MEVSVTDAKNKLTELIKLVENGDSVTITRHGVPVIDLVRNRPAAAKKRRFGVLGKKKIVLDPNWDQPIEDIDAWMRGDL